MIFRGFSFRLKPGGAQERQFRERAGACRLAWNLALEQRSNHWQQYRRSTGNILNFVAQAKELTALRAEYPFLKAVSKDAMSRALKALDTAFASFFSGHAGYPNPRRKGVGDSFGFAGRGVRIERLNGKWSQIFLA